MMALRWMCCSVVVLALFLLQTTWAVVQVDDGRPRNTDWGAQTTDPHGRRSSCPDECICQYPRHVECHAQNPSDLPPQLDNSMSSLDLYGYSYIPTQLLARLLHLTHLKISSSNIGNLKLPRLPKLEVLDVSNNVISTLGGGTIHSIVPKLIELNACDNKISNVTNTDFQGLKNLRVLELCNNPLDVSNDRFLQGLTSLRHLDLSNTKFSHLPPSLFQDVPELQYLNVSSAALVNVPQITGKKIKALDLSHNAIKKLPYGFISKASHLEDLILSHNPLHEIQKGVFKGAKELKLLQLSNTHIEILNASSFSDCPLLISLYLDDNKNLFHVAAGTFSNLLKLKTLDLSFTPNLTELQEPAFSSNMAFKQINLEHSGLAVLPSSVLKLENVTILLAGTSIHCDCYHFWFPDLIMNYSNIQIKINDTIKCTDGNSLTAYQLRDLILNLDCTAPVAITETKKWYKAAEGESALIECNVTANPQHSIVWIAPSSRVFQYNGNSTISQDWVNYRIRNAMASAKEETNIEVLETGQLLVCDFQYKDAGRYKCFAHNSVGNTSVIAYMGVDEAGFRRMYYESLAIGFSCALLFLLVTLTVQLVHYLMDWFGWQCCCCKDHLTPRAKKVQRLMETVEKYKTQQLERLRENYNGQVLNIKDSCYGQLDRVRESYSGQIRHLKDLRDYSSNQLTGLKDQYVEQCTKIGDYSMCQVNRVRENYIFQRHRIRKFSAHQLIRMRESYKYQAKTLSKILENMPDFYLQNCRTADTSSDDIEFDDPLEGIDMYYKVDFFDTMSHGSDYYTPSSTLTRDSKKKQNPGSTNTTDDYSLPSIPQLWLQRDLESRSSGGGRTHSRSLSVTIAPTHNSPELAKVHKRSLSASQTGSQNRLMPPNRITLQEESDSEITSPMLTPPSGPATPIHQASEGPKFSADDLPEGGSITPIHQVSLQQSEPATDSAQNIIESKQENEVNNTLPNEQVLEDNNRECESDNNVNKCESDSNSVCENDTLLELILDSSVSRSPSRERANSGGSSPSSYETAS